MTEKETRRRVDEHKNRDQSDKRSGMHLFRPALADSDKASWWKVKAVSILEKSRTRVKLKYEYLKIIWVNRTTRWAEFINIIPNVTSRNVVVYYYYSNYYYWAAFTRQLPIKYLGGTYNNSPLTVCYYKNAFSLRSVQRFIKRTLVILYAMSNTIINYSCAYYYLLL